jgi:rare lipoprotein A
MDYNMIPVIQSNREISRFSSLDFAHRSEQTPCCRHIGPATGHLPPNNNKNLTPTTRAVFGLFDSRESALKLASIYLILAAVQLSPLSSRAAFAGQSGVASVYSTESGSRTASGDRLNPGALTAAHRSLPFGSRVRVTNEGNGRSIVLIVNDRGPFVRGRIIDVTPAAAHARGFSGTARVTIDRE